MMAEMNERLSLAEWKLAKTEAELAANKHDLAATKDNQDVTKDELAATKDDLEATKNVLAATKDELAVTKDVLAKAVIGHAITKDDLVITKEALMSKTDELEREVAILKDPPYIHACGSNAGLSASYGTIPYTSLLYSSTNQEDGGLDISTRVFTAPWGGSYTVSWDTSAELDQFEAVEIYLQKNGESIEGSRHMSYYSGDTGRVKEQGGRTMVLYLAVGDTLQLYDMPDTNGSSRIFHTTFCVSLTTADI